MTPLKTEFEQRLETEGIIRLGKKFQATEIPDVMSDYESDTEATCIWNPNVLVEDELNGFLNKSDELHWPEYPALSLLAATKYDREKAEQYLTELEYSSAISRWSKEDKLTFQSVFSLYGKNFEKIRCWLSHKTMKELIEFYYYLKARKQIISPLHQQEKTFASNTDSKLKRCAEKVNHYEHIYDIGELQKDIEKSCDKITMDNAAELKAEELEYKIIMVLKETQLLKDEYSSLQAENIKELEQYRPLSVHNPKQIFRWEDQEIYYFSMALKEYGQNYEYISKIIETKQPSQLEKFYNENSEKFLLNAAYQEYLDNQSPKEPPESEVQPQEENEQSNEIEMVE